MEVCGIYWFLVNLACSLACSLQALFPSHAKKKLVVWKKKTIYNEIESCYGLPQLKSPGFGLQRAIPPDSSHTAVISATGTSPALHWKVASEPSVVVVRFTTPLVGAAGSPQSPDTHAPV